MFCTRLPNAIIDIHKDICEKSQRTTPPTPLKRVNRNLLCVEVERLEENAKKETDSLSNSKIEQIKPVQVELINDDEMCNRGETYLASFDSSDEESCSTVKRSKSSGSFLINRKSSGGILSRRSTSGSTNCKRSGSFIKRKLSVDTELEVLPSPIDDSPFFQENSKKITDAPASKQARKCSRLENTKTENKTSLSPVTPSQKASAAKAEWLKSESIISPSSKVSNLENSTRDSSIKPKASSGTRLTDNSTQECPMCGDQISVYRIGIHASLCDGGIKNLSRLENLEMENKTSRSAVTPSQETNGTKLEWLKSESITSKASKVSNFKYSTRDSSIKPKASNDTKITDNNTQECPVCGDQISVYKIGIHASLCEGGVKDLSPEPKVKLSNTSNISLVATLKYSECPVCQKLIDRDIIQFHVNHCLDTCS